MIKRLKDNLIPLLFCCLIAGSLFADVTWIRDDHAIVGCDVPNNLTFSVDYYYRLSDILGASETALPGKVFQAARSVFEPLPNQGKRYTNFLFLTTYPFYAVFGQNLLAARLGSFAWLLLLLGAIYLLGKEMRSKAAGITAAGIVAMHPAVVASACQYGLDLPLAAITALCLLFLLKCREFADRRYSLLLGAGIAAGLFIKYYVFLFIGAPLVYVMARALARTGKEGGVQVRLFNMGTALILVALAVWAWWGGDSKDILQMNGGLSLRMLFELAAGYFRNMAMFIPGPLLTALVVPGAYLFAKYKKEDRIFYLLSFFVPVAAFLMLYCVLPAWQERWLMPAMPAGALLAAGGIHQIANARVRGGILAAVMLALSIMFYQAAFRNDLSFRPVHYNLQEIDPVFRTSPALYQKGVYARDLYGLRDLLTGIMKDDPSGHKRILTVMLCPRVEQVVDPFEVVYWARSYSRDLEVRDLFIMYEEAYGLLDSFEYILLQLPYNAEHAGWPPYEEFVRLAHTMPDDYTLLRLSRSPIAGNLYPALYRQIPRYTLVKTIRTPFKYDWYLYRRGT